MMATSSPCEVIKTVWSRIEEFSDLPATIAVAQTCPKLHRVIVDGETRRIKVSKFIVEEYSRQSSPPHETIPHYVPTALNSIHMQSVRKIHLEFPKIKCFEEEEEESEYVESHVDIIAACFPIFATQLAYATNLQSLRLDVTKIVCYDLELYILPVMNIFRTNLANCKQLKEIYIQGFSFECEPELVMSVMKTLVPTIKRQRYVLEKIKAVFGGRSNETISEPDFALKAVATDFYENIFRCSGLQHLHLDARFNSDMCEAFLDAVSRNAKKTSSQKNQKTLAENVSLYHLRLYVDRRRLGTTNRSELTDEQIQHDSDRTKLMLERFSHCAELEWVTLGLASHVWGSVLGPMRNVLIGYPKLRIVDLFFGGCKDDDDHIHS